MLPTQQLHSLHVSQIAPDVDENKLREIFGKFGEVHSIKICRDQQDKNSAG